MPSGRGLGSKSRRHGKQGTAKPQNCEALLLLALPSGPGKMQLPFLSPSPFIRPLASAASPLPGPGSGPEARLTWMVCLL